MLNRTPNTQWPPAEPAERSGILLVPYMWIGDFVRCHSVVQVLRDRFPDRPIDVLTTPLCVPLLNYMPGVRKGIVAELPRKRLALAKQWELAARLRREGYGTVLVMPRTWKSALAPFLAQIPERTGFVGELRFGVLNDLRWGERTLPRMVDRCAMLALPKGTPQPADWPLPALKVEPADIGLWRERQGIRAERRAVALCPGAVGPAKRWPADHYAEAARQLGRAGLDVWVLGGPNETEAAQAIVRHAGAHVRDLTGHDLRNAILALAACDAAVSNDSGLLHVAAALGTPSIGIFGPTSPWHWAPLNPLAAVIEPATELPCRPCHKPTCRLKHHRCMRDVAPETIVAATERALAEAKVH